MALKRKSLSVKTGYFMTTVFLVFLLAGCGQTTQNSAVTVNPGSQNTGIPNSPESLDKADAGQTGKNSTTTSLSFVHMVDATTGWGTSEHSIWRTVNGGTDWQDVTPPVASGVVSVVEPLSANTAWVALTQEPQKTLTVFRTTDGGKTWKSATIRSSNPNGSLYATSLQFLDANHGWLLVSYGAAAGSEWVEAYRTEDSGATWSQVATAGPETQVQGGLPFGGDKTGLRFADRQNGWLTGHSAADGVWLFVTRDGGRTWRPANLPVPTGYHTEGGSVDTLPPTFFTPEQGILPVTFGGGEHPTMMFYTTRDGGSTWQATSPLPASSTYRGFHWSIIDSSHFFASDGYQIYATSDGARTWTTVTPNIDLQNMAQMDFVSDKTGWAIINGALMKTTDGGRTWSAATALFATGAPNPPQAVSPVDVVRLYFALTAKGDYESAWGLIHPSVEKAAEANGIKVKEKFLARNGKTEPGLVKATEGQRFAEYKFYSTQLRMTDVATVDVELTNGQMETLHLARDASGNWRLFWNVYYEEGKGGLE